MGKLAYRKRIGLTLSPETFDTVARMNFETMIDKTKIMNKAIDLYLESQGYEIRLNTDEENEKIEKASRKKR